MGVSLVPSLTREELADSLLYLVPGAKFAFWPDDGREEAWDNDFTKIEYHKRAGWCITWYLDNPANCPTLEDLLAVDKDKALATRIEHDKRAINKEKAKDLTLVSNWQQQKKTNPTLSWDEYLDELDKVSAQITQ